MCPKVKSKKHFKNKNFVHNLKKVICCDSVRVIMYVTCRMYACINGLRGWGWAKRG